MGETNEPTREQIEQRIAQIEGMLRWPEPAVGWETDLAVYRMAIRTLDAEAQLATMTEKYRKQRDRHDEDGRALMTAHKRLAAMTERAEKAERERDEAFGRGRAAGRDDVGKYANAIGLIDSALGRCGAMPLRETVTAVESVVRERDEARAKLAAAERDLDEAIEERKVARDDAARAAAMLTARRIELDEARAQRAESETAAARRDADGQRKRADWWRSEAKRIAAERQQEHEAIIEDAQRHGTLDDERSARLRYAVGLLTKRASEAEERARLARHDLESVQRRLDEVRASRADVIRYTERERDEALASVRVLSEQLDEARRDLAAARELHASSPLAFERDRWAARVKELDARLNAVRAAADGKLQEVRR